MKDILDLSERLIVAIANLATLAVVTASLAHCSASDTVATRGSPGGAGGAGGSSTAAGAAGTAPTSGGAGGSSATGGSGGGSGGSAAGSGGSTPRDVRSDISFDWPEGPTKNPCKAGVYQGSFSCMYMPGDAGVGAFPVSGPISMKLVQSQQGEFLEVREGLLDGTANLFFTFRADISGKLDCRAAKFSGNLERGVYSGFLVINGTFQGPLSSDYDRASSQFSNGVWTLAVDMGNGGCNGSWSAAYVGPAD